MCALFLSAASGVFSSDASETKIFYDETLPVRLSSGLGEKDCILPAVDGTYEQVRTLRLSEIIKDEVSYKVGRAFIIPYRGKSEEIHELRVSDSTINILYVLGTKPLVAEDFCLSLWLPEAEKSTSIYNNHRIVFGWCGDKDATGKQRIHTAAQSPEVADSALGNLVTLTAIIPD